MISLDYGGFIENVKIGGHILVADGLIALEILEINKEAKYVTKRIDIYIFIYF